MTQQVRQLGSKKKFLDTLMIEVHAEDYVKFLDLHGFPQKLRGKLEIVSKYLKKEQKKISRTITL